MSLKYRCQSVVRLRAVGNIKDKTLTFVETGGHTMPQMGQYVEVGATPKLIDVIKARPELVTLMKTALIQKVKITASNRSATLIEVEYVPKGEKK